MLDIPRMAVYYGGMNNTTIQLGTKVQRKGSKVVWTITGHNNKALPAGQTWGTPTVDLGIDGATEIHVTCTPKNRTSTMSEWLNREDFIKKWNQAA